MRLRLREPYVYRICLFSIGLETNGALRDGYGADLPATKTRKRSATHMTRRSGDSGIPRTVDQLMRSTPEAQRDLNWKLSFCFFLAS